jgi:hypothetical protein
MAWPTAIAIPCMLVPIPAFWGLPINPGVFNLLQDCTLRCWLGWVPTLAGLAGSPQKEKITYGTVPE